jgi:hypothetical protein
VRALALVALVAIGGFSGWVVARSAAPSNGELRKAAAELVPNRAWLDEIDLVDRPTSFSRPPWDIGGDRYAQAVLTPPVRVDEEAFQEAVARRAGATGWSRTGTSSGGEPRYRRANLAALVETTPFEPGVGTEGTIRIRPHSLSTTLAIVLGAAAGLLVGLVLLRLVH